MDSYSYDLNITDEADAAWDTFKFHGWDHFSPFEIACACCNTVRLDTEAMAALERSRKVLGRPLIINSGYRCPVHNGRVGGASKSQHLWGRAFDINTRSMSDLERWEVIQVTAQEGFAGLGLYRDFIHVDTGRRRIWQQIAPQLFEDED